MADHPISFVPYLTPFVPFGILFSFFVALRKHDYNSRQGTAATGRITANAAAAAAVVRAHLPNVQMTSIE